MYITYIHTFIYYQETNTLKEGLLSLCYQRFKQFLIMANMDFIRYYNLSSEKKLLRQRQSHCKKNLIKKVYKYSKIYNADIYVGICIRETDIMYILLANTLGF